MPRQRKSHPRPGTFVPVPLRSRADGWTPRKQGQFLGMLAQTQSVAAAARAVGMARQTAYRLRGRPDAASFALAWDRALGLEVQCPAKVTPGELRARALLGLVKPVVQRGRFLFVIEKADNSALLRLLRQRRRASASRRAGAIAGNTKRCTSINKPRA